VTGRASGRLVHGKLLSMIAECSLHVLRHKCGKNIAVNQLNKAVETVLANKYRNTSSQRNIHSTKCYNDTDTAKNNMYRLLLYVDYIV